MLGTLERGYCASGTVGPSFGGLALKSSFCLATVGVK